MATSTIRNLPEETRRALKARAAPAPGFGASRCCWVE
ncbi:FitA-like ribbon-helix-helix domain-containing protein [Pseudoclavibacter terrae]